MQIPVGIITISDRASRGQYDDLGGPALKKAAESYGWQVAAESLVPDEKREIQRAVREQINKGCALILTTGGTGVALRDVTPEAVREIAIRELPGFGEVMRMESMKITKNAILSRNLAVVVDRSLVICLPGKPSGAVECLGFVVGAIPHCVRGVAGSADELLKDEAMKHQASSTRHQRSSKHQASTTRSRVGVVIGTWSLVLLWCLAFGAWSFAHAAEAASNDHKPFVPTTKYATTRVAGWTVRVNHALLTTQSDLGSNALVLLAVKLREITNTVPARACEALKRVPIWLGTNDGHAPCAEYHPSKDWLAKNGYNPDKAKCVEIGNATRFLEWSPRQPMMILHELAHAYHDQVLGFSDKSIRAAYERAKAGGNYDSVRRNNGKTERAYALTDDHEYFAEASEAFFGTNDFYPFVREELKAHDPEFYRILEEVWSR